ncbi:hypothetical protein [uncultured Tenacibaculum sp.]|uniref:hypothetical protein n=1 Tax=uncultured Tenacibaculum sp. TaxID=174713 RepID=UPI002633762F|nr:hypothetical protein [uncultured Tenacibaculum sp.]
MFNKTKHTKLFILTFALVLFTLSTNAQEVRVIDNKGTIQTVSKNTPGDIKYGIQTDDHHGWYLLDGRSVNDVRLPTNAQTVAISFFGTSGNLPNAADKVLKHPHENGSQNIGDIGGSATTTLTRNNIPNYNLPTANTTTNGNHSHTGFTVSGTQILSTPRHQDPPYYRVVTSSGVGNTSVNGNHNHTVTVNSGGNNEPIQRYQPYLVVNTFIYLGL